MQWSQGDCLPPVFFLTKGPSSMTIGFRGGDLTPAGGSEGRAWRGQKEG